MLLDALSNIRSRISERASPQFGSHNTQYVRGLHTSTPISANAGWQTLNKSLPLTFTPGCSQCLAGPLTPVPVEAVCNHAFVIPSAAHRAAVLVDNRLPPPPVETLSLGLRCDTERKASTSSGWAGTTRNRPPFPIADCDQRLGAGAHLVLVLHRTSQDRILRPRGAHNACYVN